jgi:nitrite reductase/ring-hydroxylating ferredoxin subunit
MRRHRTASGEAAGANPDIECDGCPLMDRRGFLRTAAFITAGATAALSTASPAFALPTVTASRATPTEKTYPIPAADGVQIDKNEDLILSRTKGKIFAFNLACPHQNTAIKWEADNNRFQCPKHHSIYTPEGIFVEGRATRGLDRFTVRKDGNSIVVNTDSLLQEDEDGEKWKNAFVPLT